MMLTVIASTCINICWYSFVDILIWQFPIWLGDFYCLPVKSPWYVLVPPEINGLSHSILKVLINNKEYSIKELYACMIILYIIVHYIYKTIEKVKIKILIFISTHVREYLFMQYTVTTGCKILLQLDVWSLHLLNTAFILKGYFIFKYIYRQIIL